MRLEGNVAIITGAASGIGRAIAEAYAKEGAKVVIADMNEERMAETVEAIRSAGGIAESIRTNVTSQTQNDAMFAFALETFGSYDILVCNAGIMDGFATVGTIADDVWKRVFDINTNAVMMQIRTAVDYFVPKGGGNIIITSSVAGFTGGRAGVAYTASKHATLGLAKNTAFAYAKKGIRVNMIAPGGAKTHINESMPGVDKVGSEIFSAGLPLMPHVADPAELADVAVFLGTDESRVLNGAVIAADSGWSAF